MSKNEIVLDPKPRMVVQNQNIETERFFDRTIAAGQWMGFILFTYPTTFTVQSS